MTSSTTKSYNQISTITQIYFEPLNNPNPLHHHGSKKEALSGWVQEKEIEGEIKEATLMAAGGSEWWGRKPQPPPPIWVSQHTQGGDAMLPIVFSYPCCLPSTKASMIKTQKRDNQIWSPLVPALSDPGKIRYPTIGSFARLNVIQILLLSILAENRVPLEEEAIQGL